MLDLDLPPDGWLDAIPTAQAKLIQQMLDSGTSEEQVAEIWLSKVGASTTSGFGVGGPIQSFFDNVRDEFVSFICGDDKYEEERTQAKSIWKEHGKLGLVAMVSAAIAPYVGLAAAAIVPVIALLLSLSAKVGINAFCKTAQIPDATG